MTSAVAVDARSPRSTASSGALASQKALTGNDLHGAAGWPARHTPPARQARASWASPPRALADRPTSRVRPAATGCAVSGVRASSKCPDPAVRPKACAASISRAAAAGALDPAVALRHVRLRAEARAAHRAESFGASRYDRVLGQPEPLDAPAFRPPGYFEHSSWRASRTCSRRDWVGFSGATRRVGVCWQAGVSRSPRCLRR